MKRYCKFSRYLSTALFAAAGAAYGQQPPDVVMSDGAWNTAMGTDALANNTIGGCSYCGLENTAAGYAALESNQSGNGDADHSGSGNVAMGFLAMQLNLTGSNNTAVGDSALQGNTTGFYNTAVGSGALLRSTTGGSNTAIGRDALVYSTSGSYNTASGSTALNRNTTGDYNTGSGFQSLFFNTTGESNTAIGSSAMQSNTIGSNNTVVGINALGTNQGGSNNIAIGANAGYYIRGSRYNIDIGNVGNATDVGLIRIGTSGQQTAAYIAGIGAAHITGSAVYISSTGQLGVLASSERYKTAIAPMGESTEKLRQLRPVTFHLKTDPKGAVQYGLIAEEVAKVYPELVIRDDSGRIQGVRYEELAPMLLNEAQRQRQQIAAQAAEIRQLKQQQKQFATYADVAGLKQQLQAALLKLQAKDELVAQR